ncbi:MAG: sigma 54-interacting transcriptional regulator [Pseudomonadota bacterium]
MYYLKLIEDKVQALAESLSSALDIETTVVDNNLIRIAGTGDFYHRINENSPVNSLFARVLKTGETELNIFDEEKTVCRECTNAGICKERKSMIHPIKVDKEIIGVVCFASFDQTQDQLMEAKSEEYLEMLKHFAESIEKEIASIKMLNELNIGIAEINGIINSIDKGIVILNKDNKIIFINSKAIRSLNINLSDNKIINKKINNIISNFVVEETHSKELIGVWEVSKKLIKVVYKVDYIMLDKKNISTLISFDAMEEIINMAMSCSSDDEITFDNIIGRSKVILELIEKAKIAAKSDSTIFLSGTSGTGKELFARSIHNASIRRGGPFIAINCATLPENLIESELFGYEKGSFTGANQKGKIGKFELANNGTLFLDEIADLPLHLQAKLLRVLQDRKIDRIGSSASLDVNVRIISATHKNLIDMIKRNEFREDLFYRLNVIPLSLPPLRDREEDVLLCSEYIIKKLCNKMNKSPKYLNKDIEEKFMSYNWPGNVRELENVLEYAINFSFDDEISIDDLPEYFLTNLNNAHQNDHISDIWSIDLKNIRTLEEMEKEYEQKLLKKLITVYGDTTEGKMKIARQLGISITTLYRKLNDYS